jgi:hypothetical protein
MNIGSLFLRLVNDKNPSRIPLKKFFIFSTFEIVKMIKQTIKI